MAYEIHEIQGDTPYATMTGDFSMDDLLVILDEMRELYYGEDYGKPQYYEETEDAATPT